MQSLLQNIRYALRQMRLSPGFTATAVLTLAIGIGATTAIFTLVHSIMLKSLPVSDPAQLVRIGDTEECCSEGWEDDDWSLFSYQLYQRLAAAAPEFEETTAFSAAPMMYGFRSTVKDREARPMRAEFVTGNYFHVFGVGPLSGRMIQTSDDDRAAMPVAVMSYNAWQQSYGSDPSVVGSTFVVEGQPVTLIGIAPPGFFGETLRSDPPDFWMPVQQELLFDGPDGKMRNNQQHWLYAIGRLKPGASVQGLPARLTVVLQQWLRNEDEIPAEVRTQMLATSGQKYIKLAPAGGGVAQMRENYGSNLRILLLVCGAVLLIACANIANLLLARGTARRGQTAMRLALGATRRTLIFQQLTEAVLLSLFGGALGLVVAHLGAKIMLLLAFHSAKFTPINPSPSLPVLGFAFALSLFTGIVFGVVPAWLASHSDPAEALRGANRSTRDHSTLPQKVLVITQAALSLVLLACAGLLTTSLRNLEHQDLGFAPSNRVSVQINPPLSSYTPEHLDALNRAIEDRVSQLPNVQSASLALYSPLSGNNWGEPVAIEGQSDPKMERNELMTSWDRVSSRYFSTIGQKIVRGRDFSPSDAGSHPVAIINETFAKRFFLNEDPIGKHFGMDAARYNTTYEVIGVVHNAKYINPEEPARAMFFVSLAQREKHTEDLMRMMEERSHFMRSIQLLVRGNTQNLEPQLRAALADVDPTLTIVSVHSLQQQVDTNFDRQRMVAQLTGTFGIVALLLAAIGLYGLTAYSVTRRTSEIGIRMAVGANRLSIVGMVLRGAFLQVGIGLAIGLPLSVLAGRLMSAQLFQVRGWDPKILIGSTIALALCAMIASILPARRAASIDPLKALRTE
jgi:predicted permease